MHGFELQLLVKNARFLSLSLPRRYITKQTILEKNEANNNNDDASAYCKDQIEDIFEIC